jgi:hypothetical protein
MPTYSLWLCCAEPERSRLQDVISALAARHGLPCFAAHITLVPQCAALPELLAACAALQRATPALRVPLASAAAGHDPAHWRFRCVYLPAAAPPPPALLAARAAAEAALGLPPEAAFFPHLSLAYSECDAATREAWAAEACALLGAPAPPLPSVLLDSLQVWDTTSPDPAAWHLKESYALSAMQ